MCVVTKDWLLGVGREPGAFLCFFYSNELVLVKTMRKAEPTVRPCLLLKTKRKLR